MWDIRVANVLPGGLIGTRYGFRHGEQQKTSCVVAYIVGEQRLKQRALGVGMPFVAAEALAQVDAEGLPSLSGLALHHEHVVVDAVLFQQPLSLTSMLGQHLGLDGEDAGDIYTEIRDDGMTFPIDTLDGIRKIEVGNGRQWRG